MPSPGYKLNAPKPRTVLMTVDAVGGVWRYAMDLAKGLQRFGVNTVFAGLGPSPSSEQEQEAIAIGPLVWLDAPL
ncbi:MAG: glycosyltransferase family 1 protein, partial [Rhizobium sp.]